MKNIEKILYKRILRQFDNIEKEISFNIKELINSLGWPVLQNEYVLSVDNGIWWITHKHVGSGEPFKQFLERELKPKKWVKVIDLENDTLHLNEKGKIWTDKMPYFLNKETPYCLLPELKQLIKELNKLG